MKKLKYYMIDVFAEKRFSGNQLAVFTDGSGLSGETMQSMAREVNFSETTFILSGDADKAIYNVRIFTPEYEVPFAGHPTLGTAYVIRNMLCKGLGDVITLNLEAGRIPVTLSASPEGPDIYWMRQIEPEFQDILPIEDLLPVLGLNRDDYDDKFPIQQVSTGLPHIIVPIKSLDALRRIKLHTQNYYQLIDRTWAKNIQVFCPEAHGDLNGISTRMFTDYLGIPEDPATGSGNGCLAGYLVRHRYFGSDAIDVRSEQGYEMGRPSLLHLKASLKEGHIEVNVGGSVVPIAEGFFYE